MSPEYAAKRASALDLVQRMHAGQVRAGDVPTWHHLDRVSRMLEMVLSESGEGSVEERETISLAALGHDSLEDTEVTEDELRAVFGERGLALIVGMTNRLGDSDHGPYVKQVAAAEEAVRLIKLSDLYDNCTSVIYSLPWLGVKWTEEFFLPIVEPMIAAVSKTSFSTYPKAAVRLVDSISASHSLLLAERDKFKANGHA